MCFHAAMAIFFGDGVESSSKPRSSNHLTAGVPGPSGAEGGKPRRESAPIAEGADSACLLRSSYSTPATRNALAPVMSWEGSGGGTPISGESIPWENHSARMCAIIIHIVRQIKQHAPPG